jgi:hypothetical protein
MEESVPPVAGSFAICDFGKKIYQDKKAFDRELECLDQCDRDYILYMDWPLRKVYHVMDDRMKRIAAKLDMEVVSFGNEDQI